MLVRGQGRRAFLKSAAASAVAAGGFVNLNPAAMGANEKVTLALIGGRNQGNGDALRAIKAGARFKTFCDLDPKVLEKTGADIAKAQGAKPDFEDDFRRVLDDKEIDAVMIATPDHWHARMASLEKTGADIAKAQGAKPDFEDDFRRVLDDKEIDAVMIATPDHWHARMAILA